MIVNMLIDSGAKVNTLTEGDWARILEDSEHKKIHN